MTEEKLKSILGKYTVKADGNAKRQTVYAAVSAARSRFVPIRFGNFILNQIHYIKAQYWLLCLAYIVSVPVVALEANKLRLVLFISLAAPLLSAVTMPKITSGIHSEMIELESSMLYGASAVLSARTLIYGVINTACILVSSLFASLVSGSFLWLFLFETMIFTVSAFVSMVILYFIRNEYAPFISLSTALAYAFAVYSANSKIDYIIESEFTFEGYMSSLLLCVITAAVLVLLASFYLYIYKHYDFNGGLSYGN